MITNNGDTVDYQLADDRSFPAQVVKAVTTPDHPLHVLVVGGGSSGGATEVDQAIQIEVLNSISGKLTGVASASNQAMGNGLLGSIRDGIATLAGAVTGGFVSIAGRVGLQVGGADVSTVNPLPVSGGAAVGSAPTQPPVLTSGIDPAGLKRAHRTDGAGNLAVQNAPLRLRDQFATNTIGTNWTVTADPSDLVFLDGNALGAGWLVVSKDPMAAGTETIVESIPTFGATFRAGFGLSSSQRVLGQFAAVEVVSTDAPLAAVADAAITSIQQATTTLTVTTATAHGLKPGDRVAISGVTANNALNYPQLVVATVPNASQFTATAYPGGTIPSLTAGPYATGMVRRFDHVGSAPDGTAMIFEGGSATSATFAVRGGGAATLPSGTVNANQTTTVGSSASVQLLASTAHYTFAPTTQYELVQQLESCEWVDAAVDTSSGLFSPRYKRTQIVPDPAKTYKVRFRCTNSPSLARPVAAIVSAVKAGTSTATVTTDRPHGLATGETVTLYGVRDNTNFPNLTTATAVTVVDATHFTVTWDAAVTATSYGGVICRAGGGQVQGGISTSVGRSASTDASGLVTFVGNANWAGVSIGDLVNLCGLRSAAAGSSLGLDGAYRVREGVGGATLVLEPIGATAIVANLASTTCGGTLIKRSDLRIHFVRVSGPVVPGVFRMPVPHQKLHIAGKPEALMTGLLSPLAPGGGVLDPFAGSATIGVACVAEGRPYVGMEVDEAYFDIACRRLEAASNEHRC